VSESEKIFAGWLSALRSVFPPTMLAPEYARAKTLVNTVFLGSIE
jgi:hypothetical protein